MIPRALPKMLMIAPVSGPKLKPAMTPTTEVGIPGTAHITAVNTIKSIDKSPMRTNMRGVALPYSLSDLK